MLKTVFKDQLEFDYYVVAQNSRMANGYLTKSERDILTKMLNKDYKPFFRKEERKKLPIVTDINYLTQPCQEVTKEDNVKEIVQKLKDTLACYDGVGLTANQIGIQKKISYIKIPKITKDRKIEFSEFILINAKIIEKDRPIKISNESCLSFPGVKVSTVRYVFITVEYYNEKMELQTGVFQDIEALVIQHEISHQEGKTIFDYKWRAK